MRIGGLVLFHDVLSRRVINSQQVCCLFDGRALHLDYIDQMRALLGLYLHVAAFGTVDFPRFAAVPFSLHGRVVFLVVGLPSRIRGTAFGLDSVVTNTCTVLARRHHDLWLVRLNCRQIETCATYLVLILGSCLLYTSPSPRDKRQSRMPSSA